MNRTSYSFCFTLIHSLLLSIIPFQVIPNFQSIYSKQAEVYYMQDILDYMDDLLSVRKKIIVGGIPSDELNSLRLTVASRIDKGNM